MEPGPADVLAKITSSLSTFLEESFSNYTRLYLSILFIKKRECPDDTTNKKTPRTANNH